ncbi:universal stress protein [Enterococcus sp. 669A]|uniref:Universal stress protein n=1 Tax=Candidatus Enterococcus moelleringii TaxID=2815325 RepID=A0ABS3LGC6_9ENTE|nr:universal stress protein [Enterococcus sp. 669A]MBO1308088.1 universal stress protein [Enterococcus sp. 669A]
MENQAVAEKFQCIVTGVDTSENAQKAFKYAVNFAYREGAKLIICSILEIDQFSVYEVMDEQFMAEKRKELLLQLEEYREYAQAHGVKDLELMTGEGDPAELIVKDILPQTNADLLVIGSRATHGIKGYFGTSASYMVKHSPISVTVIK